VDQAASTLLAALEEASTARALAQSFARSLDARVLDLVRLALVEGATLTAIASRTRICDPHTGEIVAISRQAVAQALRKAEER
jgi:hypothetical protein